MPHSQCSDTEPAQFIVFLQTPCTASSQGQGKLHVQGLVENALWFECSTTIKAAP
jgi:hypothetical protein